VWNKLRLALLPQRGGGTLDLQPRTPTNLFLKQPVNSNRELVEGPPFGTR
jgi:hypothetical protein